jgi:hypothetical protein
MAQQGLTERGRGAPRWTVAPRGFAYLRALHALLADALRAAEQDIAGP